MASFSSSSIVSAFLLLCVVASASVEQQFRNFEYRPQQQFNRDVGLDQSLSYSGSGSGSVPSIPSVPSVPSVPSYGGGSPSGSGSVPSVPSGGGDPGGYGGGSGSGSGSVPSVPALGGGSGGVPSVDPSGPSGGVPSVDPSGPSGGVPGLGGTPVGGIGGSPVGGIGGSPVGGIGGSPVGGIPTVPSTGGTPGPSACSCDFWATHVNSWPDPMQLISTVSAIFGGLASNTFGSSTTLLSALENTRQDPYSQLLRQGTAAMLNAYSRPHFQYTPQAVRTHLNAALVSVPAAAAQAAKFANANRGYGVSTFCT